MKFTSTAIPGVVLVEPAVHRDERGFFMETWHAGEFGAAGLPTQFAQDNHSYSYAGVLRGLHIQTRPAQGKLVRVVTGEVFDVAVDLRRSSPTFGRWVGTRLSEENRLQIWIPPGFAHGFYVLRPAAVSYKCTEVYSAAGEYTLRWDDPEVAVDWPLTAASPILSSKDAAGLALNAIPAFP